MENVVTMTMREGVLLTHALLAYLASENGIRVLFVKGPGVVSQKLRPPHQSTDADVLIEPGNYDRFLTLIESRGWLRRPSDPDGHRFPRHSVAFYHPHWPNDIDAHISFPGFESDPTTTFDALWEAHETVTLANRAIPIPNQEASRLILAVHSLRSTWQPRENREYDHLLNLEITDPDSFLAVASKVDALAAARPFIVAKIGEGAVSKWPQPSAEWLLRTSSKTGGLGRLQLLRKTPWHKIPRTIWRDLFPAKEVLLMNDLYADTSKLGLLRAYSQRLKVGFDSILEVIRK